MSRVLIFTNWDSWDGIDYGPHQDVKDDWEDSIPDQLREIVECVLDGPGPAHLRAVDDLTVNDGIYLVYDEMAEESFAKLEQQCSEDDTFILVHDHGRWTYGMIPSRLLPKCRKGLHENIDPKHLYRSVYLILADERGDKMERVLEVLGFSRRARLQKAASAFMSGCSTPYNGDPNFLAAKNILLEDPEVGRIVKEFYENEFPNITKMGENPAKEYDSYRKHFILVRDVLNKAFWP